MTSDINIYQLWIVYPNGSQMLFLQSEHKKYIETRNNVLTNILNSNVKTNVTSIAIDINLWNDVHGYGMTTIIPSYSEVNEVLDEATRKTLYKFSELPHITQCHMRTHCDQVGKFTECNEVTVICDQYKGPCKCVNDVGKCTEVDDYGNILELDVM